MREYYRSYFPKETVNKSYSKSIDDAGAFRAISFGSNALEKVEVNRSLKQVLPTEFYHSKKPPKSTTETHKLLRNTRPPTVALPDEYVRFIGREERIPIQDLQFFYDLSAQYGGRPESGEETFFAATHEFYNYALKLRKDIDTNFIRDDLVTSGLTISDAASVVQMYNTIDSMRPSSGRMQMLAMLFLHHPAFKGQYTQVHAKKMESAFPVLTSGLTTDSIQSAGSREEYFSKVLWLLNTGMSTAAETFDDRDIDSLGFVIGLQEQGCYLPSGMRREQFTQVGIGTFSNFLEEVVGEAVETGQDVQQAIRREFLHKDGVGTQLMRTHISDFVTGAKIAMEGKSLDERRALIGESNFRRGMCPAIHKMETTDGTGVKRPIAYEYAATIVRHMPRKLLKAENAA